MPTFQICLTRDVTESAFIQVVAANAGDAKAIAICEDVPATAWEVDDGNCWDAPYVTSCAQIHLCSPKTRADLLKRPAWSEIDTDTSGNPIVWRNYYRHEDWAEWSEDWSCQCDDGGQTPYQSDWIGPQDAAEIALWEKLPEAAG
jgi:hypothetical protein